KSSLGCIFACHCYYGVTFVPIIFVPRDFDIGVVEFLLCEGLFELVFFGIPPIHIFFPASPVKALIMLYIFSLMRRFFRFTKLLRDSKSQKKTSCEFLS